MKASAMKSILFALSVSLSAFSAQAEELRLLMFEEPGCYWCGKWNAQIAPIYPKTPEGRAAPLERVQLRNGIPANTTLKSRPQFTPTFVVLRGNIEIGRIEGYPGEDFFWGLMDRILEDEPKYIQEKTAS
jgi:thioredoxin-related protein